MLARVPMAAEGDVGASLLAKGCPFASKLAPTGQRAMLCTVADCGARP